MFIVRYCICWLWMKDTLSDHISVHWRDGACLVREKTLHLMILHDLIRVNLLIFCLMLNHGLNLIVVFRRFFKSHLDALVYIISQWNQRMFNCKLLKTRQRYLLNLLETCLNRYTFINSTIRWHLHLLIHEPRHLWWSNTTTSYYYLAWLRSKGLHLS